MSEDSLHKATVEAYRQMGGNAFLVLGSVVFLVLAGQIFYKVYPFLFVPFLVVCGLLFIAGALFAFTRLVELLIQDIRD